MSTLSIDGQLSIGELAQRTGFNVSALRYYEEVGLIPPATRRPSGHRAYDARVQEVLTLIRHCRDFGFSIEETRALVLLSTSDERDCVEARDIAQVHLSAVQVKLAELKNLERSLSKFVQACSDDCIGGPAPKCTILKDLSLGTKGAVTPKGCCGA
ncbi:MAG: helix-turn-helix domain-containing protein [Pseudomonadota bacterium]